MAALSETELLAKLIEGEPTQVVHQKTLLLVSLLNEAGDLAAAPEGRGGGIAPDVGVKPMSGEPVARRVIGAHRGIIARGRATVRPFAVSAAAPR